MKNTIKKICAIAAASVILALSIAFLSDLLSQALVHYGIVSTSLFVMVNLFVETKIGSSFQFIKEYRSICHSGRLSIRIVLTAGTAILINVITAIQFAMISAFACNHLELFAALIFVLTYAIAGHSRKTQTCKKETHSAKNDSDEQSLSDVAEEFAMQVEHITEDELKEELT